MSKTYKNIRAFKHDERGDAARLRRDVKGMDPMQMFREFVHNGIEAGATRVIVDGWTDPDTGRVLTRITDNGSGMSHDQMVAYLSTLDVRSKGDDNYGVGARIASVPTNPAGVVFASRTGVEGDGMVWLYESEGVYGIRVWDVVDDDGFDVKVEVVAPDDGMLSKLKTGETGTAVILYGDGTGDTWTPTLSYRAHKFLSERYYDFPEGVSVTVPEVRRGAYHGRRPVVPFGAALAKVKTADGVVPFENINGLSGHMYWWTVDEPDGWRAFQAYIGGVGLVTRGTVDGAPVSEVFSYSRDHSSDFGVIYKSVQNKVAILIHVDGAEMDTLRANVVLPAGNRGSTPWKMLGAHFAANMPPEIDALLSQVTVSNVSFDADMARLLDEDWMKNLDPVKVAVPASTGDESTGDDEGDAAPRGDDFPTDEHNDSDDGPPKKRAAAKSSAKGDDPADPKPKALPPGVQFMDANEVPGDVGITWQQAKNVVTISTEFPPYVREIGRWRQWTNHPEQVVTAAVQSAYGTEFAATIVDANGQTKFGASPETVERLKSDEALYTKALGMQSLTERVKANLTTLSKDA